MMPSTEDGSSQTEANGRNGASVSHQDGVILVTIPEPLAQPFLVMIMMLVLFILLWCAASHAISCLTSKLLANSRHHSSCHNGDDA